VEPQDNLSQAEFSHLLVAADAAADPRGCFDAVGSSPANQLDVSLAAQADAPESWLRRLPNPLGQPARRGEPVA
jgi:hypothetical protein